jgi:DNA-binding MurR/RpiR family transcriptional regulator
MRQKSRARNLSSQNGKLNLPLPQDGTVAERIRVVRNHLAPAEFAVANAIIENYPTGGLVPIVQLSANAHVSAPTVLRLIDKLGFNGYGEFHKALRAEIQQRIFSPVDTYPVLNRNSAAEAPTGKAQAAYYECVRSTFSHLDPRELKSVVSALADVDRPVFVMGGRISFILALHLATYLSMLRRDVTHIALDGISRVHGMIELGPKSVAVIFDFRHYQQSVVDWGIQAAKRRAHIVLFTDQYLSPLASRATSLLTSSTKGLNPFDSMVGAFAVIELVISEVARSLGGAAKKRLSDFLALQQADESASPGMTAVQKGLREK